MDILGIVFGAYLVQGAIDLLYRAVTGFVIWYLSLFDFYG